MGRGARSIRGSLGAYLTASLVALAALALALWLGWPLLAGGAGGGATVELADDAVWVQAVLDDGRHQYSVARGERVELPSGSFRVTLLASDGRTELRVLEVDGTAPLVLR